MQNLDWGIRDKVAIITASGGGIGAGIAEVLVTLGAKVVIHDKTHAKVQAMLKKVQKMGGEAIGVTGDIRDSVTVVNLLAQPLRVWGRVDFLVNNVGVGHGEDFPKIKLSRWQEVMDTNVSMPFQLTQKFALQIEKQKSGGAIVFITSVHQDEPGVNTVYGASKSALKMIIKELALRLGPKNIRVNGIAPGAIRSKPNSWDFEKIVPFEQRRGSTQEIGYSTAFLLSPTLSSYTTGSILTVDGGLSLVNWINQK